MLGDADNPLLAVFRSQPGPAPRVLRTASLYVTEFVSRQNVRIEGTVPPDDAYVVTLHLQRRPQGSMRAEGRWLRPENFASGNAGIVDLRLPLTSEYAGPFHCMSFYLKRTTLDEVAADAGARSVGDLRYRPGVGFSDPIVRNLLCSLRPALAVDANEISRVYADHVALAFVSHMACAYGAMLARPLARGGLTPTQERRAKELLDARLEGSVSLSELAQSCELSVRHFARAFRRSTGQSPHRWLIERRLDKAQGLLAASALSLTEIARTCGFASQSHFTRVFSRALGVGPAAWRRARRP